MGSPASRRFTKLTPLTTRPPVTSRQGMMRLANIIESRTTLRCALLLALHEVSDDTQSQIARFLGMKLHARNVVLFEYGRIGKRIFASRRRRWNHGRVIA